MDDVNVVYEGTFENGKKHGQGRMHIENGSFTLESKYVDGHPEHETNQLVLRLPKTEAEEEKIDPKAKKPDPKAAAQAKPEEDKEKEAKNKLVYEIGKSEAGIEFEMHMIYQGASYEDPNPPAVEEQKQAAPAKGGKAPAGKPAEEAKPEIRMITPDPVLMINESGRTFEFELGRFEKVKRNGDSVEAIEAPEGITASTEELT